MVILFIVSPSEFFEKTFTSNTKVIVKLTVITFFINTIAEILDRNEAPLLFS